MYEKRDRVVAIKSTFSLMLSRLYTYSCCTRPQNRTNSWGQKLGTDLSIQLPPFGKPPQAIVTALNNLNRNPQSHGYPPIILALKYLMYYLVFVDLNTRS